MRHRCGIDLAAVCACETDACDFCARPQPLPLQHWFAGVRRHNYHVRTAHRILARHYLRTYGLGELLGSRPRTIPDADLLEAPNVRQSLDVTPSLRAGSQNCQGLHVGRGNSLDVARGHGRGPHLGDQPSVHRHEGFAGLRAKQDDHTIVRVQVPLRVSRIDGDELGARGIRTDCRHAHEEAAV